MGDLWFPLIAFGLWLFIICGLSLYFWIRPQSFFSKIYFRDSVQPQIDVYASIAAILAILMFVSCFIVGSWVTVAEIKGAF